MVKIYENLIKLTEYSFAYSLIGLLTIFYTHKKMDLIDTDITIVWPIIVIIGILGTALSIIDPFGNLIRFILRFRVLKESMVIPMIAEFEVLSLRLLKKELGFLPELLSTRAISYEIDKVVSTIYFLILIHLMILIISDQGHYSIFVTSIVNNTQNSTNIHLIEDY